MAKKIIQVEDLVKRFKKSTVNAVDGVSFEVEEGSMFSLLGPNGAGKTTIISILTTLLSATSGKALVDGEDTEKSADEVRKRIGVIFQKPSLDLNLSAEENIRFHANLYGLYGVRPTYGLMSGEYKKRITMLAEVLGLENDLFKPVKNLSGGMKRKLEIIRSLMHKPKVLFLDEPTTGLDPVSRQNLWKYLQDIRVKEDVTIFLTTHYLEEAEVSDFVCIVDKGKIVSKGTPTQIKNRLVRNYMTVDSKDRESLVKELLSKKMEFEGEGPYKVVLGKHRAQEVVKTLKTELSELEIRTPSLEDAYIEIVTKNEKY